MKRPLVIGTLLLLVCAGAFWIYLQTQGVDRTLFSNRWPQVLAEQGFTTAGRLPLRAEQLPLPLWMKCNPRFWNEPEWAATPGPIRIYRYSECLVVRHDHDVVECRVRHGTTRTEYAEVCYEKGREPTAQRLASALSQALPGLIIRLREVPSLLPMATGPQPVMSEPLIR